MNETSKELLDANGLHPKRFTKGKVYRIVGDLPGTDLVIVEKDDLGGRSAICGWRFGNE